jgi:hypothetical protein
MKSKFYCHCCTVRLALASCAPAAPAEEAPAAKPPLLKKHLQPKNPLHQPLLVLGCQPVTFISPVPTLGESTTNGLI